MADQAESLVSRTFNSDKTLLEDVARRWVDLVAVGACHTLALSGGRMAAGLFDATCRESRARRADWYQVDWFWADERLVTPDHADSNYRTAHEHLLVPLGVRPDRVHRIRGEDAPGVSVAAANAELRRVAGAKPLDLVLLGMGEDGHVASLFPGLAGPSVEADQGYCFVVGPKPPPHRVTLTYGEIIRARSVWVIVGGAGKAEALSRALQGDPELPLGRVIQARRLTELFVHV